MKPVHMILRPGTSDAHVYGETTDSGYWSGLSMTNRVILDLGANIGSFALWAAANGAEHVRAIEPDQENYAALVANLGANPHLADRIAPWRAAAGPRGWVRTAQRPGWPAGAYTVRCPTWSTRSGPSTGEAAACLPLADLLDGLGDDVWVKVDIEGDEYALFADAGPELLPRIAALALEWHQPGPAGVADRPGPIGDIEALVATLEAGIGPVRRIGPDHIGGLLWANRR